MISFSLLFSFFFLYSGYQCNGQEISQKSSEKRHKPFLLSLFLWYANKFILSFSFFRWSSINGRQHPYWSSGILWICRQAVFFFLPLVVLLRYILTANPILKSPCKDSLCMSTKRHMYHIYHCRWHDIKICVAFSFCHRCFNFWIWVRVFCLLLLTYDHAWKSKQDIPSFQRGTILVRL